MNHSFTMTTSQKHNGLTLYDFLNAQFPFLRANASWQNSLVESELLIEGCLAKGNPLLKPEQCIEFTIQNYQEGSVNTKWQILWENDELMVVHKPALLPMHRTTRNVYYTLTALVRRHSNYPEAQALHRLDLETAGIVLFSKTKLATLEWQPRLNDILKNKTYQAIVYGKPDWHELTFSSKLNTRIDSEIRCQMYVVGDAEKGKESTTEFKLLASNDDFSIIKCTLKTGRKHQIRAHLAALGHPIVGDKIYANQGQYYLNRLSDSLTDEDECRLLTPHHLLVAQHGQLAIADDELINVAISEEDFPNAWHEFLLKQNNFLDI